MPLTKARVREKLNVFLKNREGAGGGGAEGKDDNQEFTGDGVAEVHVTLVRAVLLR